MAGARDGRGRRLPRRRLRPYTSLVSKRRKFTTHRCLGADCGAFVRMRVTARPKRKPPGWHLVSIRTQDGDTGVLRQAQVSCCSPPCVEQLDEASPLAQRLLRYLRVAPPPPAVRYVCARCGAHTVLVNPAHAPQHVAVPDGWVVTPLVAVDHDSGIVRISNLPLCSAECASELDGDAPLAEQPEAVRDELVRLYEREITADAAAAEASA